MKRNYGKKVLCITTVCLLGLTGCANKYQNADTYIDYATERINSIDETFLDQSATFYEQLDLTEQRQEQLEGYTLLLDTWLGDLNKSDGQAVFDEFSSKIDEIIDIEFITNELESEQLIIDLYESATEEQQIIIHDYVGELLNIYNSLVDYLINNKEFTTMDEDEVVDVIKNDQTVLDYIDDEETKLIDYIKDNSDVFISLYNQQY